MTAAGRDGPGRRDALIERAAGLLAPGEAGLQEAAGAAGRLPPSAPAARMASTLHALLAGEKADGPAAARSVGQPARALAPLAADERARRMPLPARAAEEFRQAKNRVLEAAMARGAGAVRRGNMILVASACRGEGRTFFAVNLALAIAAERDLSVLLVDADLDHPGVVARLGVDCSDTTRGFLSIVSDPRVSFADCIVRSAVENLSVLPAGRHRKLTSELLVSERMAEVTGEIARRYLDRIVIFDTPPALTSPVGGALAAHVGQLAFVVEAEATTMRQVAEGLARVSGCERIELVLNRMRLKLHGR